MLSLKIEKLIKSGLSEAEIARRVNASQPTIHRIKKGGQVPSYPVGIAIDALYSDIVEKKDAA